MVLCSLFKMQKWSTNSLKNFLLEHEIENIDGDAGGKRTKRKTTDFQLLGENKQSEEYPISFSEGPCIATSGLVITTKLRNKVD